MAISDRVKQRIERLQEAYSSLAARYDTTKDKKKKSALRERLGEFEQSMTNLKEHGVETIAGRTTGVDINTPVRRFSLKGAS